MHGQTTSAPTAAPTVAPTAATIGRATPARAHWLTPALALAVACSITASPQAQGAIGEPCPFTATVDPTGADGATVTLQWGVIWGDTCEWSGFTTSVSENRIDLIVLQESDWCFAAPMNYCTGEVAVDGVVPPGTYEVHVSVVAAWDGSRGQTLHDFGLVGTLIVPEATPCGTIVESDFNDGNFDGWTFVDLTFAGVGEIESRDGAARLFSTKPITALDEVIVLGIADSELTPALYADGTIELVWRSATSRPVVQVGARLDAYPDANSGYYFTCVAEPFNIMILQRQNLNGTFTTLSSTPMTFAPDVDYRVRCSFVDDTFEFAVWVDGAPEPAPQISVIDASPILSGGPTGFAASRSQGSGLVDISFSDFTFTLPNECEDPGVFGDLNDDGIVDGADLGLLLNNWGGDGIGDLNGDGVVDGADLGLLLTNWG